MNLDYNFCVTSSRDDTSSSIALLNSTLVDAMTFTSPYLATCNSLSIYSFSDIKNLTLELVASTYALVTLANASGCMHTLDMITRS